MTVFHFKVNESSFLVFIVGSIYANLYIMNASFRPNLRYRKYSLKDFDLFMK